MTNAERTTQMSEPVESAREGWAVLYPGDSPAPVLTHDPEGKPRIVRLLDLGGERPTVLAKWCDGSQLHQAKVLFEELLGGLSLSVLRFYGVLPSSESGAGWLFVEESQANISRARVRASQPSSSDPRPEDTAREPDESDCQGAGEGAG